MKGNLRTLEKELRSYAKRCKNVKYTSGLLLTFLLTGMLSLANSTSMSTSDSRIEQQKKNISNSILDIRQTFKKAKSENNKLLRGANLELIIGMVSIKEEGIRLRSIRMKVFLQEENGGKETYLLQVKLTVE